MQLPWLTVEEALLILKVSFFTPNQFSEKELMKTKGTATNAESYAFYNVSLARIHSVVQIM